MEMGTTITREPSLVFVDDRCTAKHGAQAGLMLNVQPLRDIGCLSNSHQEPMRNVPEMAEGAILPIR